MTDQPERTSAPTAAGGDWTPAEKRAFAVRDAAVEKTTREALARMGPQAQAALAALPYWWGECIQEWRATQQMLTDAGIPVGRGAQAGSDLDTRIALHVLPALANLRRIAEAHHKNIDAHGGTYGDCNECSWSWPCPTHVWATDLERDAGVACWNPADDDE